MSEQARRDPPKGENRTPRRHSSLDPPSAAGKEQADADESDERMTAKRDGMHLGPTIVDLLGLQMLIHRRGVLG